MNTPIDVLAVIDCAAETLVRMKGAGANPRLVNVQRDALIEARAAVAELIAVHKALMDAHAAYNADRYDCPEWGDEDDEVQAMANRALARVQGGAA